MTSELPIETPPLSSEMIKQIIREESESQFPNYNDISKLSEDEKAKGKKTFTVSLQSNDSIRIPQSRFVHFIISFDF